ncbi:hypothetical protein ACKVMH_10055 [Lysobacter zhanggongensis]|uniref:Uncharacterized protein n=1 Tax=Lysobacter zhanggongensis TaxID=1774951 RepID=A0ABU7YRQ9_9GAMM
MNELLERTLHLFELFVSVPGFPRGKPTEREACSFCGLFETLKLSLGRDVVRWNEMHEPNRAPKREAWRKFLDHGPKSFLDARKILQLTAAIVKRVAASADGAAFPHDPRSEVVRVDLDVNQRAVEKLHSAL